MRDRARARRAWTKKIRFRYIEGMRGFRVQDYVARSITPANRGISLFVQVKLVFPSCASHVVSSCASAATVLFCRRAWVCAYPPLFSYLYIFDLPHDRRLAEYFERFMRVA